MPEAATFNRRQFLAAFGALAASGESARNVLFIASDDLNHALGCYGHPLVKSPHIDRLAASGVRFDRAYCQFPFCGPSRASLLTGLRPDTVRVTTNERVDFREHRPDTVTLPQMFRNQGRKSLRAGKIFHMGVPGGVGTMAYQDPPSWDVSISPPGLEGDSPGEGGDPNPGLRNGLRMQWVRTADDTGQADTVATDLAFEWLAESRDQPFFLGLGLVRPHVPFVAPAEFYDLYQIDDIEPIRNPPDDLDDIPAAAKDLRPFLWNNMGMSETDQRLALRGYYASVSYMDRQVGRALDALEKNGLADNTIVVFFGDHGWHLGEHTHWQKMSLMEESVRAPLIIRAPGAKGNGRSTRALAELVDLFPTLADLCGLEAPPGLEGVSLRPVLEDPSGSVKDAAFSQIEYEDRIYGRTVRTDRYRFIEWRGDGAGEELYDHQTDPREFTNLAADPSHADVVRRLRELLAPAWAAAVA